MKSRSSSCLGRTLSRYAMQYCAKGWDGMRECRHTKTRNRSFYGTLLRPSTCLGSPFPQSDLLSPPSPFLLWCLSMQLPDANLLEFSRASAFMDELLKYRTCFNQFFRSE